MITTVTLNPMLDKTVRISALHRGKVHRASHVDAVVGGKGVNVSRQLRRLNGASLATGFVGGDVGATIERLLDQEGLPHRFIRIKGNTREGVTYLEPDGTWTAIFEPPHQVTGAECDALIDVCRSLESQTSWFVCSGSSPDQPSDAVFAAIVGHAKSAGIRTALDSYGLAFALAVDAVPTLVKLNREEFEQTFKCALTSEQDILDALDALLARGIGYAILTDGARAVYTAHGVEVWKVTPPAIQAVNPTGSGDSMTAGLLFGLVQHWELDRTLRFGTAAGASNASMWQVASSSAEEIAQMERNVRLVKIKG